MTSISSSLEVFQATSEEKFLHILVLAIKNSLSREKNESDQVIRMVIYLNIYGETSNVCTLGSNNKYYRP